jgi:translation elongation factor P/translation initiation factor 5A
MRTIVDNKYIKEKNHQRMIQLLSLKKGRKINQSKKKMIAINFNFLKDGKKKVFTQCIANEIIEKIAILMAQIYC